ncbi:Talin_middle domain-containing protein [Caenorhabditis elegans]|uniref:Talin_middle domain-containing protein n=1 Tax=Caenorhabditis elegans TaxID=6239 RepID=Q965Q5_CAEEL|nr:Talin_middle domain-containing protein [Caenorhabditis elegans]CCD73748.1 Talin_middle domain-containing protein [Caenorhabditis elegans]|eukprot:NP_497424.1 Uncharacterized protein CELE_Y22D7AL.7 [Caenorhabditis elegans]
MDEEVVLELASQQAIKFLLAEPKFAEKWQMEIAKGLREDLKNPSTSTTSSNPAVTSIESTCSELTSTIQYVIDTFEAQVDPRNCYISPGKAGNRDAAALFEAGLRVEKLAGLDMQSSAAMTKNEENCMHIGAACRRVSQVLKSFGKRFQGQPSLEIQSILPIIHRLCRLFYTISHEICRFSTNFRSKDRKLLKTCGKSIEIAANEFNLRIVAEIEMIENHLKFDEKRREKRPPPPTHQHRPSNGHVSSMTRHQRHLATSINDVINGRQVTSSMSSELVRRAMPRHPPGGIATSIVSEHRGYLMDDNLKKARQRIAHVHPKRRIGHVALDLNIDKNSSFAPPPPPPLQKINNDGVDDDDDDDDVIMRSARKMTELVLADMRKSMNF